MLKFIKRTDQAGVTLLETILVLSLIAIIMVGGINLYSNASSSTKAIDAQRQIVTVATGIQSLYSNQTGYRGLNTGTISANQLRDSGAVPAGMVDGNQLYNTFGGVITYTEVDGGAAFGIVYRNVPKKICTKLLTSDLGGRAATVGGTPPVPNDTNRLPLTPTEAIALCTGEVNSLAVTFD